MKKPLILAFVLLFGVLFLGNISSQDLTKQENKMADVPQSYFWVGQNGQLYVKNAASGYQVVDQGLAAPQVDTLRNSSVWSEIPDPSLSPSGTSSNTAGGTTGGVATSGVNDPATLAAYDQAIGNTQAAINRLPDQLNSANQGVDTSFTNALNQLLLGKNQANQSYTTNKQQTGADFVQAKNTIGANAGSTLSGLLRLLGSRGAGGSSTALLSAPGAVAAGATQQRTGAANTFGANNQALDTNWNNYLTGYNNQVAGAGSQRDQQKQAASQQNQSQHATLLQSLAQLTGQRAAATGGSATGAAQPYLDQANGILNSLSNYTVAPINYQTQAYTAPSLSSYSTNPQNAPTYQGQPAGNDYTSPYLSALLKQKQPATAGG